VQRKQPFGEVVESWLSLRRDLAPACKRAGVPRVTPNVHLRTFASWMSRPAKTTVVVSTRLVDLVTARFTEGEFVAAAASLPSLALPPGGRSWVTNPSLSEPPMTGLRRGRHSSDTPPK
jgi:hypothetical protein